MANSLSRYADKFDTVAETLQEIGLDSESGLYGELRDAVHEVEKLLAGSPNLNVSMLMLRRHEKDFMLRRNEKYKTVFDEEVENFRSMAGESESTGIESSTTAAVLGALDLYTSKFQAVVDRETANGLAANDGYQGEMRSAIHTMENQFEDLHKEIRVTIEEAYQSAQTILFIGILLTSITVAGICIFVAQSIYKPIGTFKERILEIADTKNLNIRLNYDHDDELGYMGKAFDQMIETLHDVMEKIKGSATQVEASANLMSTASIALRNSSDSQNQEIEQASAAVTEMNATTQEIARNASEAADTVTRTLEAVVNGSSAGEKAKQEIQALTDEVQEAGRAIQELEEKSKNITSVLDTIQGIAEQTNLLALNAAIEAARAGEQGRGFAVVADEVRTLAQRTQESTITIRDTIEEFQTGTSDVVAKVTQANLRGESGIELVSESAIILRNINELMLSVNDMNTQIAAAAEEQSHAAEEINRNVMQVNDISHSLVEQSQMTSKSSDELLDLGQNLNKIINEFQY
jgi:methyl-accepting chemotaxis protein